MIDETEFLKIKEAMNKEHGIKVDDMFAVEGCMTDDKTVLGGRQAFLSHFCTFYNFNICHSQNEMAGARKLDRAMSDSEFMGSRIDEMITNLDKKFM